MKQSIFQYTYINDSIAIVGCFKDHVESIFSSGIMVVGVMLLVTAFLLSLTKYIKPRQKNKIGKRDAFIIGLSQAVAVIPGLSRSGTNCYRLVIGK